MRFLPRLAAVALLAACSGNAEPSAGLTILMFTGDLDLPEDTDLVGLYIAQIDAGGRTRRVLAFEATPLRERGKPARVPFPADFVVGSRGEADRVHVRLVAYSKQTREVLTMREARTEVPTDDQRGLRLNLFFTNQNNVQDATPGAPVLAPAAAGLSTLDDDGEISSQAFERFTSICNGAPAPDGMTAGDDGSCVPLDVPVDQLPLASAREFLAGTRTEDRCYDVEEAFGGPPMADARTDVLRIATSTLPPSGECRVPLPAVFDPARLNVAMVTSRPVFEKADKTYSGFRPLAASLAFRHVGSEIVLPAHVCDLARAPDVSALAFSQRAATWGGLEPVCSKWNRAAAARPSDGAPPEPLPDAGPDAAPDPSDPVSASYDMTTSRGPLVEIAARASELGIVVGADVLHVALLQAPLVDHEPPPPPRFSPVPSMMGSNVGLVAVATSPVPTASTGFYLLGDQQGFDIFKVQPDGAEAIHMAPPTGVESLRGAVLEVNGVGTGVWTEPNSVSYAALQTPFAFVTPPNTKFGVGVTPVLGVGISVPGERVVMPASSEPSYVDCDLEFQCALHTLPGNRTDLRYAVSARAGARLFGFYRSEAGAGGPAVFEYDPTVPSALGPMTPPVGKTASLDDSFCGVFGATKKSVRCFTATALEAELRGEDGGLALLDGAVETAAVAADATSLTVAYQCADGSNVIHVTRIFSGHLHTPGALVNRCLGDAGTP